jgi:ATP-dependent RNA helicase RhlE
MPFLRLNLREPLQRALREEGYTAPTPIQAEAIPSVLAGKDVLAIAQTGTGKTAAFVLPILERLAEAGAPPARRRVRVLVLAPTRELAAQVSESFGTYGRHLPFRRAVVFGGVSPRPQVAALQHGVDILVATPGRLLDLMHQRRADLSHVETVVLDEADRMLDMGFAPDVQRILSAVPRKRQTLFFSATMPPEAQRLADRILVEPVRVEVAPPATTVESVAQSVFFVERSNKARLLEHLLSDASIPRALVFTRTKRGADKLAKSLVHAGVDADAIHGNKSQGRRERTLDSFRSGGTRVLVATDIAARGLDVEGITHVVNFDLPNEPESYVHRIGRTARAGATGVALSFCDPTEEGFLRDIERTTRVRIGVVEDHPFRRAPGTGRPPAHGAHRPQGHAPAGPRYGRPAFAGGRSRGPQRRGRR